MGERERDRETERARETKKKALDEMVVARKDSGCRERRNQSKIETLKALE